MSVIEEIRNKIRKQIKKGENLKDYSIKQNDYKKNRKKLR